MIEIPFIGQAYTLPSVNAACQRCLNMYMEGVPGETKGKVILKKRSGLKLFTTVTGANRKIYSTSKDRLFSVNGNKLTEITASGARIERGTIATSGGNVSIQDNGNQMAIVDGSAGYVFDLVANVLTAISAIAYPDDATQVTYQDGFIIVNNPSSDPSGNFNISGIRDALSWSALDFGNAEASPDIISALTSTGQVLWLLGPTSIEAWYNSGAADFPFQRISGAHFDIGIFAPFSLAKMDSNIFWLGSDQQGFGQIFTNNGYTPTRISTHAIEQEIVKYPTIEDALGFTMQEGGHSYYVITFQAASKTWAYDVTTQSWFEWAYTNYTNNTETQYKGSSQAFFKGKNYVADSVSGDIFEVDPETLTDNGNKIKILRNSPHIWNGLDRIFYNAFQVDMETGIGLTNGQGNNPQAMLRWSDDGGHVWSNQMFESAGKIGEYKKRVKFNRLGQARDRVWEFTMTDPVKITLLNAHVKVGDNPNG